MKIVTGRQLSKFSHALHDWDDSILRVMQEGRRKNLALIHPMIGEEVNLKVTVQHDEWWKNID